MSVRIGAYETKQVTTRIADFFAAALAVRAIEIDLFCVDLLEAGYGRIPVLSVGGDNALLMV